MKQLHPGARWSFRFRAYFVMIFISLFVTIWTFSVFVTYFNWEVLPFFSSYLIMYILVILIVGEIYARMAYNRWFYEFTPSQLRFERGIVWKKYSNVPYERIQNVDITRGIMARILGFSTVNIQTAGYSYTGSRNAFAEGYLPAVSVQEAERIREFVIKKISKKGRSQGL